jgi:SOS-response transcriptional repressor LexA
VGITLRKARKRQANHPAGLTRAQARVLAFIREYIGREGVPPSYQNIADALGYASKGRIARLLAALEDRGAITIERHRARSIALVEEPPHLIAALPDDLRLEVVRLALKAKVDPEDVLIEAARDGIAAYWRRREVAEARARL